MFGSTARCVWILAAVATAGCGFKANVEPSGSGGAVDAGSQAGNGGVAGTAGGGGKGGATPVIIVVAGSTGTDGGHATGTLDSNCGVKTQSAKMIPPDIMLVMDRSLSMTNDVSDKKCTTDPGNDGKCGPNSKWELMVPALNRVITDTDAKVNWGMFYLGDEPAQCGVATAPVVPVATMNATAITTSLTGNQFTGQTGTPTRRAVQGAVSYLTGLADQNPKYLLLATDGQPNCATAAANSLNTDDSAGTRQAVADALAAGIPTFVVGIGNTGAAATLDQVAIAGGRPQTGGATSYYQVNDAAALGSALGTIVGQAASCSFNIGPAPDGTTATGLGVFGDGTKIPMDPANGWSFKDTGMTTIILNGSICDQVMAGTVHDVTVAFVCMVT